MINRVLTYTGNIPVNQPLPRNKNKLKFILARSKQLSNEDNLKSSLHKLYKSRIYNYDINQETINENLIEVTIRFETNFHAYDPEFYKTEKFLRKNLKVLLDLRSTEVERPEGYNKPEIIYKGVEVKVIYENGVIYDDEGFDKAISLLTKNTQTNNRISQNRKTTYWEAFLTKNDLNKQDPDLN